MDKLPQTSHQRLRTAIGWLELGNFSEAVEELERLQPALQRHPLVLKTRWSILAASKKWTAALKVSRTMTELLPNRADAWILHANTLYGAGEIEAAYELAREKARRFRCNWELHYHLAHYACRLGKIEEAERWLEYAIELGNDGEQREIRWKAWQDQGLRALWGRPTKLAESTISSIEAG